MDENIKMIIEKSEKLSSLLERLGFIEQSQKIKRKIEDFKEPFMLMVVGEGNFGKSTLINSLFENEIAPTSILPKTWKIDIYEKSDEEKATLYYLNSLPTEVTVEEALRLCEIEEKNAKNNQEWKSNLYQVRWKRKGQWFDHIAIVDTPGFAQFRKDISVKSINIFGSKGIEIEALDIFDHYFYRADFVFWCLKATKLEDSDTINKLETLSNDKSKKIGIITFIDRIPTNQWDSIIEKANKIYSKYFNDFLLFTGNRSFNQNMVNNLKGEIINYIKKDLLPHTQKLKYENFVQFYLNTLNEFYNYLENISKVYEINLTTYYNLEHELKNNIDELKNKYTFTFSNINEKIQLILEARIPQIYDLYRGDYEQLQNKVNEDIINGEIIGDTLKPLLTSLFNDINSRFKTLVNKINWTKAYISTKTKQTKITKFNFSKSIDNIIFEKIHINVNDYFENFYTDSLLLNVIRAFIDFFFYNNKRKREISKINELIISKIKPKIKEMENLLSYELDNFFNNYKELLVSSFKEIHLQGPQELISTFYELDSFFINKIYEQEIGVIDCFNSLFDKKIHFSKKLIKFSEKAVIWDSNAFHHCRQIINSLIFSINKLISDKLVYLNNNYKNLSPLELKNVFKELILLLPTNVLENPILKEKEIIKNLVYANGNLVYNDFEREYLLYVENKLNEIEKEKLKLINIYEDDIYDRIFNNILKEKNNLLDLINKFKIELDSLFKNLDLNVINEKLNYYLNMIDSELSEINFDLISQEIIYIEQLRNYQNKNELKFYFTKNLREKFFKRVIQLFNNVIEAFSDRLLDKLEKLVNNEFDLLLNKIKNDKINKVEIIKDSLNRIEALINFKYSDHALRKEFDFLVGLKNIKDIHLTYDIQKNNRYINLINKYKKSSIEVINLWDKKLYQIFENNLVLLFEELDEKIKQVRNEINELISTKNFSKYKFMEIINEIYNSYLIDDLSTNALVNKYNLFSYVSYNGNVIVYDFKDKILDKIKATKNQFSLMERELKLIWDKKIELEGIKIIQNNFMVNGEEIIKSLRSKIFNSIIEFIKENRPKKIILEFSLQNYLLDPIISKKLSEFLNEFKQELYRIVPKNHFNNTFNTIDLNKKLIKIFFEKFNEIFYAKIEAQNLSFNFYNFFKFELVVIYIFFYWFINMLLNDNISLLIFITLMMLFFLLNYILFYHQLTNYKNKLLKILNDILVSSVNETFKIIIDKYK